MSDQNFKNHGRYVPLWHIVTPLVIGGLMGWAIVDFMGHHMDQHLLGARMIVISFVLLMLWWYSRYFALKAHDKAIRAEEGLRHYILTGKPLDRKLRMGQVVALRFASDSEFPALAKKAVEENLSPKQIKEAITNWRADHNRV
jgi:hypothetical protein